MKRNCLAVLIANLLLTGFCFYSEKSLAQEVLWKEQVAWEGVPEYYQIYPNTGHVYTDDMKIEMLDWFEKFLK